ncbi:PAS domain-containing protein [Mycobacterium sp. 94-17]|uniref:PAS domain-containing protein n=1 Tax=Mycobacterium sp. 94-17 TaxID=2986147 RepID=UPI002D1EB51A|nr:PAS domain-containing protein [Mycobacterium sp. 94-17]MEB4207969.1 PAS domain-containing protein [Mycobacterium sp. 94-17]
MTAAPYLLLDANLDIQAVNDAYLRVTSRERDELIGEHMFDAFPDNPADAGSTGVYNLQASFTRVLREAAAHQMPIQRYDVAPSGSVEFIPKIWSPVNSPITDDEGRVVGLLHHVEDVTPLAADGIDRSADARTLALTASRYRSLHDLLVEENTRLTDALLAVSTSRGLSGQTASSQRRRRLWRLLVAGTRENPRRGWSASLCALAVEALDTVVGAAISVQNAPGELALLTASDARAGTMDQLGAELAEGPMHAALLTGVPVHVADLASDYGLWPGYAAAALDIGIVGVSAFPMMLGSDLMGAFTVCRSRRRRAPDHGEWIDTAIVADLAVSALLADGVHVQSQLDTDDPHLAVTVAAGMLSSRFDISLDDAVNKLRRRADRMKVPVRDVGAEVVRRWSGHS